MAFFLVILYEAEVNYYLVTSKADCFSCPFQLVPYLLDFFHCQDCRVIFLKFHISVELVDEFVISKDLNNDFQ